MSSRFDWRDELANIAEGMQVDLQQQVGQSVPWYVFDQVHTVVDDLYDVGAPPTGRVWKSPVRVPVLSAVKIEGAEVANSRGLYTVSTLRLAISVQAARLAGLGDLVLNPEGHVVDRIVYENKVFDVSEVRSRGVLTADYAVIGVDCAQVKSEELVNDSQFRSFIARDQD